MMLPYNPFHAVDTKGSLQLLFGETQDGHWHNGDIYDVAVEPPRLVCSSGPRPILTTNRPLGNIVRTAPTFDATVIRLFCHNGTWYLSTRRQIDACNNTWHPCTKTFGQLLETFVKPHDYHYTLDEDSCYTFLLISPEIQNVLPATEPKLFFVYQFNSKTQTHCPNPTVRPPFAQRLLNSQALGTYQDQVVGNTEDGDEKVVNTLHIETPQRGWLYYMDTGELFQCDFELFKKWEAIVANRPWRIVYYEVLKKHVKGDPHALSEFLRFYPKFLQDHVQLFTTAQYIVHCHTNHLVPQDRFVKQIWDVVLAKNVRPRVSWMFVLRQIAFMKYHFLDAYLKHRPDIPIFCQDFPFMHDGSMVVAPPPTPTPVSAVEDGDMVVVDMENNR